MSDELFDAPFARCVRATEKAILVTAPDLGEGEHWLPQSAVDDDSEVYQAGDEGRLVIAAWFARKQGWL